MEVYKVINDQERIVSDIQPGTNRVIYKHQMYLDDWSPCWKCDATYDPKIIESCPNYRNQASMTAKELEKEKWGKMYNSPLVQKLLKRKDSKMTTHELFDRVCTWNSLLDQIPLPPPSNDPRIELIKKDTEDKWNQGLLQNASELEVPKELQGTNIQLVIEKIINLSRSKNPALLSEITILMKKVQKDMYDSGLT